MRVSRTAIERACRLAQGLLDAATGVGFSLKAVGDEYRRTYWFQLFGHSLHLGVTELTRREPHVLTQEEVVEQAK